MLITLAEFITVGSVCPPIQGSDSRRLKGPVLRRYCLPPDRNPLHHIRLPRCPKR